MLDINFIRENTDLVKKTVVSKKSSIDIDQLLSVDVKRRELLQKVEQLRQQKNELSSSFARLRGEQNESAKARDIEKGKALKDELEGLEKDLEVTNKDFHNLMILVPNVYSDDTPEGADESGNQVIRGWGEAKKFDHEIRDHIALGELLGIIDIESAAKVTGARFAYLKGQLVLLQLALLNYTLSVLQNESVLSELAEKIEPGFCAKPFIPVLPPMMIKPEVYVRMARLDSTNAEERYHLEKDDLYLIGSAEHTLGPLHMDQILNEAELPIRYVGYSASFRREAGSYGKDTKGILRVHQFDKIEIESFSLPENSLKEQNFIISIQEHLMQSLGLPYQVVAICIGDMGGPDFRQIDIETWIPSQNKFRETHTSDLMTDYQARRLETKVRRADGKTEFVHMNDATVFAMGRILIAILENNQQEDGSVKIPEVLVPFTGFSEIKPK